MGETLHRNEHKIENKSGKKLWEELLQVNEQFCV